MRISSQEILLISFVMMPITAVSTTTAIVIVSSGISDNAVLYVHKRMSWLLVCNANVSSACAMKDKCVIIKSIVFGL